MDIWACPGIEETGKRIFFPGRTKSGAISRRADRSVSCTRERIRGLMRNRRRRVAGKGMSEFYCKSGCFLQNGTIDYMRYVMKRSRLFAIILLLNICFQKEKQKKLFKSVDTCGVSNLHGLPGLFGGLIAIFVVPGLSATAELTGIAITIILALGLGLVSGKVISLFGHPQEAYSDAEEFADVETE